MAPLRLRDDRSATEPLLYLAIGVAAGFALGAFADRGVTRRLAARLAAWVDATVGDDTIDDDVPLDTAFTDTDEHLAHEGFAAAAAVAGRVLEAFENDPVLCERALEIDAPAPGAIALSGTVPSARDAAHAVTIARGVPGVVEVENAIRVRGPRRRGAPGGR
jgi:hypothetical protein